MDLSRLVCHLIDTSADTRFFRVIAQYQDRTRFPVMVGSLAPEGPLQTAMRQLGTPTFALVGRGQVQLMLAQKCQGAPGMWLHLDVHTAERLDALYEEWTRKGARRR